MLDFFIYNSTAAYFLVIATFVLAAFASANVRAAFSKYNRVNSVGNVPANVIARQILDSYGLYNVQVTHVSGNLSDHYDPKTNVVALSDATYFSSSVAAIGVAAHETGHAVQYAKNYLPIKIRSAIFPIVQFGSSVWMLMFLIGFIFTIPALSFAGICFYAFVFVFQVITLPVEFNASKRAINAISAQHLLEENEMPGAKKTLRAAAMTYIASALVSFSQLIRLLSITNRRRR